MLLSSSKIFGLASTGWKMNGLRKNYHTYLAVCDSTLGELKDTTKVANPATSQLHSFNGV